MAERMTKAELVRNIRTAGTDLQAVIRRLDKGDPNRVSLKAIRARLLDAAVVAELDTEPPVQEGGSHG